MGIPFLVSALLHGLPWARLVLAPDWPAAATIGASGLAAALAVGLPAALLLGHGRGVALGHRGRGLLAGRGLAAVRVDRGR